MQKLIKKLEKVYQCWFDDLTDTQWNHISVFQELSEDFIREFEDKVNCDNISAAQTLSPSFKKIFRYYLNDYTSYIGIQPLGYKLKWRILPRDVILDLFTGSK